MVVSNGDIPPTPSVFRAHVGSGTRKSTGSSPYAMAQQARKDFAQISKNWSNMVLQIKARAPEIMVYALKPTFDLSQKYVPKKTHALQNSGYIEITDVGNRPRVEVGYGKGGVPPYAAIVHEKIEYKHQHPTRSKFLQAAMEQTVGEVRNRLIDGFKTFTGAK